MKETVEFKFGALLPWAAVVPMEMLSPTGESLEAKERGRDRVLIPGGHAAKVLALMPGDEVEVTRFAVGDDGEPYLSGCACGKEMAAEVPILLRRVA